MDAPVAADSGQHAQPAVISTEQLTALMARLNALESDLNNSNARFNAAAAEAQAREARLQSQVASLSSALNQEQQAGWHFRAAPPATSPVVASNVSIALQVPQAPAAPAISPAIHVSPPTTPQNRRTTPPRPSQLPQSLKSTPSKAKGKKPKKNNAEIHRVTKDELPPDVHGFKEAFFLHLYILWAIVEPGAVPVAPSDEVLRWFQSKFPTIDSVMVAHNGPNLISPGLVETAAIGRNAIRKGTIAWKASKVEKSALLFMQAFLARFGFKRWAFDFSSTPYSPYNSACRIVAILSFQQAMLAHAYIFIGPVFKYVQDMPLLIKLFDHFVMHIQYPRFLKHAANPNLLALQDGRKNIYQRRQRLMERRIKQLKKLGLDRYTKALEDPKCHSDDELDTKTGNYIIKQRPGRSARWTRVVRELDARREAEASLLGQNSAKKRIEPPTPRATRLPALPKNTTLDWFDVDFYNKLSVRVRKRVGRRYGVVLHPEDRYVLSSPPHAYETMPMGKFMELWGDQLIACYDYPESDADSDESDEEEDEDQYWLDMAQGKGKKKAESSDVEMDDEQMAEAVDAALNEEQNVFMAQLNL